MDKEFLQRKLQQQREQEALAWRQLHAIQGSIAMLEELLSSLDQPEAMTTEDLRVLLGAKEVGEPESL